MNPLLLPDSEGALRAWLRSCASITALCEQRQYFEMPKQDRPETPFILLYRIGGAPDDKGQDYPDFIIECWGENKHRANLLARTVSAEIMAVTAPVLVGDAYVMGATVNFGPTQTSGQTWAKRYRIDASFHIRSST